MTVATEIYATGVHPYNQESVCVARTPEEKQEQRSFFFWYKPEMRDGLRKSLNRLGLTKIAARLLDGRTAHTVDVTPPPHITPCGMSGRRLAAAQGKPTQSQGQKPGLSSSPNKGSARQNSPTRIRDYFRPKK